MPYVIGEFEVTNEVALAPNALIYDGATVADGDLTVRVNGFNYNLDGVYGRFLGAFGQAVTDNTINYVYLDHLGNLVINTTGYPVAGNIFVQLARVFASGGFIVRISLERAFFSATAPVAGFVPTTRTLTAGAGLTGGGDLSADRTFDVGANVDGSITVNPNDIQVGTLATDSQHGARGGGTQHSLVSGVSAGFMSTSDKTKLDGIETGATHTPLTSSAPADVTKLTAAVGISTDAARSDHKHDISTDTAVSLTVGGSNAEGSAITLARSDHTHALPSFGSSSGTFCQGNDSRLSDDRVASGLRTATTVVSIATATAPTAGQLLTATSSTAADWQDPAIPTTRTITAGAGLTGGGDLSADRTINVVANVDGSITVNADDIQVGILATDTQHGSRGGGSLHSAVTTSVNGFMSSTDKTKLDGIASGATDTPLSSSPPADVDKSTALAGSSTSASRADHKHNISTASAISLSVGGSNTEGSSTSLARADHTHALPSFGSTSGTFCEGNDSRLTNDRTASGLRTATTVVSISSATAPTSGQVLTAISGTSADWETPLQLTSNPPANVTKATAAVGTGTAAARDDHKHDITTATAGAATPGDSAAEGTATSLARSDHQHSLPAFGSTSGTFCQGNDSRLSNDRTASGLRTATTIVVVSAATAPSAGQVLTATSSTAADWETPTVTPLTSNFPANVTKAAAVVGVGTAAARDDHKHDVNTATASSLSVGGSNAEGTATSLSRSDHTHAIPAFGTTSGTFCQGNDSRLSDDRTASGLRTATTIVSISSATAPTAGQTLIATSGTAATWQTPLQLTSNPPSDVTKSTATVGVATVAAREDHKHDITTAAAVAISPGGSNTEGSATTLARSDHTHSLPGYGTPVAIGTTNSAGSASTFSRSDHVHDHGSQTSGTLHAVVTSSVNGFMSASDKSKLDLMSPDFGRDFLEAESLGQSTTTAVTFQTKLSLATGAKTGKYLLSWYCMMSRPSGGNPISARFFNTTSSSVVGGTWSKDQLQITDMLQFSGSVEVTLSGTSNTFAIQYEGGGGNTAAIQEARIEMWRVSA